LPDSDPRVPVLGKTRPRIPDTGPPPKNKTNIASTRVEDLTGQLSTID
jgi:hypothetical protein